MDRRRFAKLSALALAATRLPAQAQPDTAVKPIGFAAVGLGIISGIFSKGLTTSTKAHLVAVVTGHPDTKGRQYTQQYNLPANAVYTYDTYNKLRDNRAVDAVYIGLPNSMHCDFTVRAAEAGKHVLCEKPMAISSAECRRMIDACRHANVKLMIAYRVHYDPTWLRLRDLIRSGEIGEVHGFQGGFYAPKQAGEWRLDRKLSGGGSLMDLGIYPLNAIRWLNGAQHAGEEPASYTAQATTIDHSGKFFSVEEAMDFTFKFPSGVLATAGSSYGENGGNFVRIDGTAGSLVIDPAYSYEGLKYYGHGKSGPISGASTDHAPFQFTLEADHLADCIRLNRQPSTPGEEGLADLLAMEAIYKAAGAPIA
jgi:predicted dehydrogenase